MGKASGFDNLGLCLIRFSSSGLQRFGKKIYDLELLLWDNVISGFNLVIDLHYFSYS